jgi:hypothetical protein
MKSINIDMADYEYPQPPYDAEQPYKVAFYSAPYSLEKEKRTRGGIVGRAEHTILLPLPKEPQYSVLHEYAISNDNPISPILTRAGIKNSGGVGTWLERRLQPATVFFEKTFATSTYRRFSNIGEMSMVAEGRKQFLFEYIFVPKNEKESIAVDNICGTFRKTSYPTAALPYPERSYPQNLWVIDVISGNQPDAWTNSLAAEIFGEPLPCVLKSVEVKRADDADPIMRFLPNGRSNMTLLALLFQEFETGTYVPGAVNAVLSKSEIATGYL